RPGHRGLRSRRAHRSRPLVQALMAVHLEVVVDVADADRAVRFWAAALGYQPFGSFDQYRSLVDPDGVGPKLVLQQVDDAKTGKNRVHLDLHVADVEAEVAR